jgi:hypothetical protein
VNQIILRTGKVEMAVKKIAIANSIAVVLALVLSVTSVSFVNHAVELGFLTGVNGRRLVTIPFSGGIGIGVVNLIPITGLLLVIGAAVHAATGISWRNSTDQAEG